MADRHASIDRRSMIKKAALATGAAWVAPTVIATAAGAATSTTYFAKLNTGNATCQNSEGGGNSCAGVPAGAQPGCGQLGTTLTSFSVNANAASASVSANCTITHIEVKYGNKCDIIPFGTTSATVSKGPLTDNKDISHANVVWTCTTGS